MYFEHVNLTVADVDRSVAFYQALLGFGVRWRGTIASGQSAAHVGDEKFFIAMFQAEREGKPDGDYGNVGINHFGFVVDDLDDMKRRLESLGVKPHSEQDYEPGRRIYFLDPDGIEVELVEYQPSEVVAAGTPAS
jgi:catechol 2,3-dioxygenase-like lactoylglutathione lyase family enzyme